MAVQKKIALLDTDFVSKTHIVQVDAAHHLADLAINLPDYSYCCHQMTVFELSKHGIAGAPQWLQSQINAGKIRCYTDKDILDALSPFYDSPQSRYRDYLKNSCDVFESGYYQTHFAPLISLPNDADDATFLQTLDTCKQAIGEQKSLGEKMSLVLLQLLQFLQPNEVYVFCSDDGGARRGVTNIGGVHCINVLSLFYRLKELGFDKATMEPYFSSYEAFVTRTGTQTAFKVWKITASPQRCRVSCRQVFDEIYDNKFRLRKTGDLEYIT